MIVIDASAVVELITELKSRPGLHDRLAHASLIAPDILPLEVASALRGLNLGGYLSDPALDAAAEDLARLPMQLHPSLPLLPRVLALRQNFSAYDASYLALAETFGCPLLTADAQLAKAAGRHCVVEVVPEN